MARSARSAKRPPKPRIASGAAAAAGAWMVRNPGMVGGTTTFLVSLFYVSANALWYQPHAHLGAFFPTRAYVREVGPAAEMAEPETTILIQRPAPAPQRPQADPAVQNIQRILKSLAFYAGDVDGLVGPATTKAIQTYQQKVGLPPTGRIDAALRDQLGAEAPTAGIAPARPPPVDATKADATHDDAALARKVQAGLRAFGNADIDVDGVIGARTRVAIQEFQALFGLQVTGAADKALYVKMKSLGFVN